LDPPEFVALHDRGNLENVFDRFDYNLSQADSLHLNFQYSRSWFQTPNTFDNLNVLDPNGNNVGNTDQRSKIGTFNLAPTWTRLISSNAVFTLGAFVRRDQYNYYRATIRLRTWDRLIRRPSLRTGSLPTRAYDPTSPT